MTITVLEDTPVHMPKLAPHRLKIQYGEDEDGRRYHRNASRGNKKAWKYGEWTPLPTEVSATDEH